MRLPSWLTTVTPFYKLLVMIVFITFPIIGFVLGMKCQSFVNLSTQQFISTNKSPNIILSPTSFIQTTPEIEKSKTIISPTINSNNSEIVRFNLNGGAPNLKYFISQIRAPSDYFATDDNMIDSYLSQGGMVPPRIILMKDHQVSGNNYYSEIHQSKNDCIVIWSTNGFNEIDDWNNNVTTFKGTLTENQTIKVGTRKAQIYKMVKNDGDIFVALLQIGNSDNTTYFFHTCNINNRSDFINVIQSIKFRDDAGL